jgi:hypothetical protein
MSKVIDWHSPIGGNWAYMVKNQDAIERFIQGNKLEPVEIGPIGAKVLSPAKALIDLGIRGGIRVPHLHFKERIYMLNRDQWAKFSAKIIEDCRAKLANVKEVGFEEGILLGSVAQTLG